MINIWNVSIPSDLCTYQYFPPEGEAGFPGGIRQFGKIIV